MVEKDKTKIEAVSALKTLADLLKINLNDSRLAIATLKESATVRMHNGSLEAELVPTSPERVYIDSPKSPGIQIELIDHQKNPLAPANAIYCISAYHTIEDKNIEILNGDIYQIYVGKEGLILNDPALCRASELYKKKKMNR